MKLGYASIHRMLEEMTWQEFQEWQMYAQLEPFDEERMDVRFASLNQVNMNLHGWDKRRRPRPFSLLDGMIFFGDARKPLPPAKSWQELKQLALFCASLYNAEEDKAAALRKRAA